MPSTGQENPETVMIDFFGALRRGDFDAATALPDPDVSWQGLRDEWVCHGREEVVETFRWGLERRREIDALEFTRGGEQVVLGARGALIPAGSNAIKATNGPTAPRPSGSFLAPDLSRAALGLSHSAGRPRFPYKTALTEFTHPTGRSTIIDGADQLEPCFVPLLKTG